MYVGLHLPALFQALGLLAHPIKFTLLLSIILLIVYKLDDIGISWASEFPNV